jgi:hypothetical protein
MLLLAYYKCMIIRNREYSFLCNSNRRFYDGFQKIEKGAPLRDSSSNLNLNLYEPVSIINYQKRKCNRFL